MDTVTWLKDVLSSQGDTPGETLLRFFKACDKDVTASVLERISKLIGTIPLTGSEFVESWDEKPRIDLGIKLYYRVLELMLKAEETRLGQVPNCCYFNYSVEFYNITES